MGSYWLKLEDYHKRSIDFKYERPDPGEANKKLIFRISISESLKNKKKSYNVGPCRPGLNGHVAAPRKVELKSHPQIFQTMWRNGFRPQPLHTYSQPTIASNEKFLVPPLFMGHHFLKWEARVPTPIIIEITKRPAGSLTFWSSWSKSVAMPNGATAPPR